MYLTKSKNGVYFAVDEEDAHVVQESKWGANHDQFYVRGKYGVLSRYLLGVTSSDYVVDHINGNPLDNRRVNLRIATQAENKRNAAAQMGCKYKGLIKVELKDKPAVYGTRLTLNGEPFDTPIELSDEKEAARLYDGLAIKYHKDFAYLNFPRGYEHLLPKATLFQIWMEKHGPLRRPEEYPFEVSKMAPYYRERMQKKFPDYITDFFLHKVTFGIDK